ncbi:MAG: hypothetical protein ACQEQ0_11470 [Bacteroidota bacterium]
MEASPIVWTIISTGLIAVFTLILVKLFLNHEAKKRRQEFLMQNKQTILRHQLQAFERFTLYLERISPESLVLREQKKNMNAFQLQNHLLKTIRNEFNHNMAMQIFVPGETWEQIKKAREEVIRLINTSATQVPPSVPSFELGRYIIENAGESTNHTIRKALESIRSNVEEMGIR